MKTMQKDVYRTDGRSNGGMTKVIGPFELRSLDSVSRVLNVTPRDQLTKRPVLQITAMPK